MSATTATNHGCLEISQALLRGERSAVQTYDQAIEKFSGEPEVHRLHDLRREHVASVEDLEARVLEMGGAPDQDSGAWGTFANTVQAAANLFGENAALTALLQGENHGRKDYEDALEGDQLMPECRENMERSLLPRVLRNIEILEELRSQN